MWNKLRKNIVFQYSVAVVAISLVAYFAIAPALLNAAFPQYAIVKKYTSIEVCTDLPPGTPSKVFLPVPCASLGELHKIGCVYNDSRYIAPIAATADEKTVCPTLVSGIDATGAKNKALATIPVSENAMRNILSVAFIALIIALYVVVRILIRRVTRKNRVQSIQPADES